MHTFTQQILLLLGTFLGFISVALGAFGAHALKQKLSQEMMNIFEIGARYQMYHALIIFTAVWISTLSKEPNFYALALLSGWLFVLGTIIFSGSLYALAITEIKTWGIITPIGGMILLIGWLVLAISIYFLPISK